LTYSDGTAIAANDALTAGQTRGLKLTVLYDPTATELATTDTELNISAVMLYVQK
jgi:hypothetical protein